MAATISEVAELAGVSTATVSRVFNGSKVSEKRRKLVEDAATQLAFVPNRAARTLRRRNSEIIALVIPDIENPFFTAVSRGVEDIASRVGYSVVLCNTDDDQAKEARYLEVAISESMAGVVIAPTGDGTDLSALVRMQRPVVTLDRTAHGFPVDSVVVDSEAGSRTATAELVAQGFRRIACITGPQHVETATVRAGGWAETLRKASLAAPEHYLRHGDYRTEGGYAEMMHLLELDDAPDAVFVANNLMALGALRALSEHSKRPGDFGVAVFGDLPFSMHVPGISIVSVPAREVGEIAATMLMERIRGDDRPPRFTVVSAQGETTEASLIV